MWLVSWPTQTTNRTGQNRQMNHEIPQRYHNIVAEFHTISRYKKIPTIPSSLCHPAYLAEVSVCHSCTLCPFYASIRPDWQAKAYCFQRVCSLHVLCPPIRSSVSKLPNMIFWKWVSNFFDNGHECFTRQEHRTRRRKWRHADTDVWPCGETQTMSHIVKSCPPTKLNGGLSRLHSSDADTVSWVTNYGSWHAYEKKKKGMRLSALESRGERSWSC